MTDKDKPMKIEFAPGCFDNFDGTQEELDELVAEIKSMFEGKTREEIESQSRPMTEDSFNELDEEEQLKLIRALGLNEDLPKRTLQ